MNVLNERTLQSPGKLRSQYKAQGATMVHSKKIKKNMKGNFVG